MYLVNLIIHLRIVTTVPRKIPFPITCISKEEWINCFCKILKRICCFNVKWSTNLYHCNYVGNNTVGFKFLEMVPVPKWISSAIEKPSAFQISLDNFDEPNPLHLLYIHRKNEKLTDTRVRRKNPKVKQIWNRHTSWFKGVNIKKCNKLQQHEENRRKNLELKQILTRYISLVEDINMKTCAKCTHMKKYRPNRRRVKTAGWKNSRAVIDWASQSFLSPLSSEKLQYTALVFLFWLLKLVFGL